MAATITLPDTPAPDSAVPAAAVTAPAKPGWRRVWPWVRLLTGVAIIAALVWKLGTAAFLDGLRVIDAPTVLAALGIGAVTTVFCAWRWRLVAGGLGVRLPLLQAVASYYRSLFLNAALPGGVLGDVHRAVRHGRQVGDVGRSLRAVILERTAGQVVLVAAGIVMLFMGPARAIVQIDLPTLPAGTVVALSAAGLAVTVPAGMWLRRSAPRWLHRLRGALREMRQALLARRVWPGVLVASVMVLAGNLATFLLAAHAAGLSAPVATLLPLMLLALLAMALPLNVGGWGPREGACAWAFAAAGLGATQGVTVAVVYGLLVFVASTPGLVVLGYRAVRQH